MGLYDDDNAAVTSGDQNNDEYAWAKAFSTAIDNALKTRQAEYAIKHYLLPKAIAQYDKALAVYPAHEDLKKWKAKATTIQGKLSESPPSGDYKPDFIWSHSSKFLEGMGFLNWAQAALTAGDRAQAKKGFMKAEIAFGDALRNFRSKCTPDVVAEMERLEKESHDSYGKL